MNDDKEIYSCLARMRESMVKKMPEALMGSVADVLECALNLEIYQNKLESEITALKAEVKDFVMAITNLLDVKRKNSILLSIEDEQFAHYLIAKHKKEGEA